MLAGCQSEPVITQYQLGKDLYAINCAHCHDLDNGIGPKLKPEVIATRTNAKLFFEYNKRNMPYQAGNTLLEDEYWSITGYILMREGFMDSTATLSAENALEIGFVGD